METTGAPPRHLANFSPCIWGDRFLSFSSHNSTSGYAEDVEGMKNEVRGMLMDLTTKSTDKIEMIDSLHRLGLSYHFEKEIDYQLDMIFKSFEFNQNDEEADLFTTCAQFRVFRQHGYKASSDQFNKFKDSEGKFKETLASDTKGMLSLYEASQLRLQGDDDLEEALAFTTRVLMGHTTNLISPSLLEKKVIRALQQPFHKGIPRVETRFYISIYEEDELHNNLFLKLAKLDFNVVQELHQTEISLIFKWWEGLDVMSRLPYVRDRVVECYLFVTAVYFDPSYSLARIILAKILLLVTAVDDTYDAYGTIEELQHFTDAIARWDINCIDKLPDYMKFLYTTLLNLYDEFQEELTKDGKSFSVYYVKEATKEICRSYYQMAKWFKNGYVPTLNEYSEIAYNSSTVYVLTLASYMGMGEVANKEAFEFIQGRPKILKAAEAIGRLRNDIGGNEVEQKRGHVASSIECYMKEFGVSRREAVEALDRIVVNAWKDLNEQLLKPTVLPMPLLLPLLNTSRYVDVIYKNGDAFTDPQLLKECTTLLFLDHVPV